MLFARLNHLDYVAGQISLQSWRCSRWVHSGRGEGRILEKLGHRRESEKGIREANHRRSNDGKKNNYARWNDEEAIITPLV